MASLWWDFFTSWRDVFTMPSFYGFFDYFLYFLYLGAFSLLFAIPAALVGGILQFSVCAVLDCFHERKMKDHGHNVKIR